MTDNSILHIGDQTYDLNNQTPMMVQYLTMKAKYPNALLLYRMGDFYELFFEDAKKAAKLLDITLTRRGNDKSGKNIPMAGVPFHAADSYMARMIAKGQTVVICEQIEEDEADLTKKETTDSITNKLSEKKPAKGIMKREVVRTLTAGTITEDALISPNHTPSVVAIEFDFTTVKNNSVLQPYLEKTNKNHYKAGISSLDLAAGTITAQSIITDNLSQLQTEIATVLARFEPSECLINEKYSIHSISNLDNDYSDCLHWLNSTINCPLIEVASSDFSSAHASTNVCQQFGVRHLDGLGIANKPLIQVTAAALIHYARQTQQRQVPHVNNLIVEESQDYLIIDDTCQRNLEIFDSVNVNGTTLIKVLNHCKTSMGRRLLPQQLKRPLRNRNQIKRRADVVQQILENTDIDELAELQDTLTNIADIERISSRICLTTAKPRDLYRLANSIRYSALLEAQLTKISHTDGLLAELISQMPTTKPMLIDIAHLLENAIKDEPPAHIRDGGMIKQGYDEELDRLTSLHDNVQSTLDNMAQALIEQYKLPSLKVGYNKVSGFYFELPKAQASLAPESFIRRQTLKNSERYLTEELKTLETDYLNAQSHALAREKLLYNQLLNQLTHDIQDIQLLSRAIAQIDILVNWAFFAREYKWHRPHMIDKTGILDIKQGRHLVVEAGLIAKQQSGKSTTSPHIAHQFVANDSIMGTENTPESLLLITGPNMGGKSTYMRQVALIVLLASCGSFVPASYATIGDIDRIFTRIGSADDLAGGKSTFMVEMIETAHILNLASKKSLVLMDEVGRGTSTTDGLAIAYACVKRLADMRCLTLFATHYFELTQLADSRYDMRNVHVSASEIDGKLLLLHQIKDGAANSSFGLHVAKMAGVPSDVLKQAQNYLTYYLNENLNERLNENLNEGCKLKPTNSFAKNLTTQPQLQADLFDVSDNEQQIKANQQNEKSIKIANLFDTINPDDMTAKQALDWIYKIKNEISVK